MAPVEDPYKPNERVLCFHGQLLYEAKVIDVKPSEEKKGEKKFLVHYKGWKNTWDDWVQADRIRKDTEENKELARNIKRAYDAQRVAANSKPGNTKKRGDEPMDDEKGATARGKRGRNMEIETEEDFQRRPEISLPLPDHLKSILVDDWEYVTKNLELVTLPSKTPVSQILEAYEFEEKPKRHPGSADEDLLEEFVAGMHEYFNSSLGRILLYTQERPQYQSMRQLWEKPEPGSEWVDKNAADVYGAEHFLRLMVKMPELVAQTNMDKQAVDRMREELSRMAMWLGRNAAKYCSAPYEKAPPEWVAKRP